MPYISEAIFEAIFDRELKKGSAELLILSLIEHRPRHGYEISKLIEKRSNGVLRFNVASFYPLLYRLEKRGFIEGHWVDTDFRGISLRLAGTTWWLALTKPYEYALVSRLPTSLEICRRRLDTVRTRVEGWSREVFALV